MTRQDILDTILVVIFLLCLLAFVDAAFAKTIGSAPWCVFNGFTKQCLYYSYSACEQAAEALNASCVPN